MEDKRLNFNRPLISVRRFPSKLANSQKGSRRKNESSIPALLPSPSYKSELHSGPLRNPGTVPFVWEQIPGRPKDGTKTQKTPMVPNLPPGRILKPKTQDFDIVTKGFYVEKGLVKDSFESFKDSKNEISDLRNHNNGNGNGNGRENEKPQVTYGPNFLQLNDDDSDDDSDFDYNEHGNMSFKFCGLLPHFCLKGSIGMLNSSPGLSVRTRLPISSADRTRVAAGSQDTKVAAYEPKSLKQQKDLTIESTEDTNQKSESPPPFVSVKEEVNTPKKGLISFKELLAHENEKEACFENHTIEKTLYVDTVHKVETLESDFKENDVDIFGISHIPADPIRFDLVADDYSKHDKEMITQTCLYDDPKFDQSVKVDQSVKFDQRVKVDQKGKVAQKNGSELPAPPPLPKSPSDSWLWRTLPSVNSKTASLWSNYKPSSKTTRKVGKTIE